MKYSFNPFNSLVIIGIIALGSYTAWHYENLIANGGWGLLGMLALAALSLGALLLDLLMQWFVPKGRFTLWMNLVLALVYLALVWVSVFA